MQYRAAGTGGMGSPTICRPACVSSSVANRKRSRNTTVHLTVSLALGFPTLDRANCRMHLEWTDGCRLDNIQGRFDRLGKSRSPHKRSLMTEWVVLDCSVRECKMRGRSSEANVVQCLSTLYHVKSLSSLLYQRHRTVADSGNRFRVCFLFNLFVDFCHHQDAIPKDI